MGRNTVGCTLVLYALLAGAGGVWGGPRTRQSVERRRPDPSPGRHAQPGGRGTVGADIIVLELAGLRSFGSVDTDDADFVSAFAVGTDSCNIGDEFADWDPGTNDHPVIAQNMYRLSNGRFEQIGMSWLKHGFFATNTHHPACSSGCRGLPGGFRLQPGCSDLYVATLNGQQSNLGPRSVVNVDTGFFPGGPIGGGADTLIERRLQVRNTDLDPALNPGAAYFVEGHYVVPDDAAAGNGDNNASHIRIKFVPPDEGGVGCRDIDRNNPEQYCAALAGSTYVAQPAIMAWRSIDPSVVERTIDVPGEGRFILSAKVAGLPDGFWRYEYALYNLNSDRSAGSFMVPVPADAAVRHVGFHDVFYHSGEPFDATDWPATIDADGITWAITPFETDPNANALRWSTLYNFRFEADAAPDTVPITVGLFKPGTPSGVPADSIGPRNDAGCGGQCDLRAVCDNGRCHCMEGYSGDGITCMDINECDVANGGCAQTCTNGIGGFACTCDDGFALNPDGASCDDIDECAENPRACDVHATCTNTTGSFDCACRDGWSGDGLSCQDVDECRVDNGGCAQLCVNTEGAFACLCTQGFELEIDGRSCRDIDECAVGNGGCEHECTNLEGAFLCSCDEGFVLNRDGRSCDDVNECKGTSPCDRNAACENTLGGFACVCLEGFAGDGFDCAGICGDGVVVSDEECDDGNTWPGDGCSPSCAVEPYHTCTGQPSACVLNSIPTVSTWGLIGLALMLLSGAKIQGARRRCPER